MFVPHGILHSKTIVEQKKDQTLMRFGNLFVSLSYRVRSHSGRNKLYDGQSLWRADSQNGKKNKNLPIFFGL